MTAPNIVLLIGAFLVLLLALAEWHDHGAPWLRRRRRARQRFTRFDRELDYARRVRKG